MYIYIYGSSFRLMWAIKASAGLFYFCHLNKAFKKLSKTFFTLPEKLLSSSTF